MDHPRVLVVDDDVDVGELMREALSRWGHDVTLATSGREAVRLISHQIFDAALVDIWMPEMDGLQVLDEIKRHDPALEVVMMTGNPMVETAVQALKSGAYDYLIKPLNLDEMQHSHAAGPREALPEPRGALAAEPALRPPGGQGSGRWLAGHDAREGSGGHGGRTPTRPC